MEDGLGGRSWPLPMSHQDVALRQRCARLLQAVQRIEAWQSNQAKETLDLETPFSMLTKGCVEATEDGLLEAPIYSNSQIEAAWLFLFEVRRRYFNRRKQIQDCTRLLGSSPNWSMVLLGSKKIRESLRNMPPEARSEILEDAGAMDLMTLLSKAPSSHGGFTPNGGLVAPEAQWPEQPARPERPEARGKKNPFVDAQVVAPDPSPNPAPSSGWPPQDPPVPANLSSGWPAPSVPSMPNMPNTSTPSMPNMPNMPNMPSAPSNPFRKESDRGEVRSEAPAEAQGQVTAQDMMAGAKFAQESGLSANDMMSGARYAQQSGVTPQHALEGARMAHQAGVRPQHVFQGAQMAHQAGLRPQHFVQGAKAAQQAGVTPQHVLAAGKAFAAPQR